MMAERWSTKKHDIAVEAVWRKMYFNGDSDLRISKATGYSKDTVGRWRRREGLAPHVDGYARGDVGERRRDNANRIAMYKRMLRERLFDADPYDAAVGCAQNVVVLKPSYKNRANII